MSRAASGGTTAATDSATARAADNVRGGARAAAPADPVRTVRRAVLWVPDWPVVAAMAEAGLEGHAPAAVQHGRGMIAVSAAARSAGVRRGMRKRQAQRACPEVSLLPHDEGRDARAFEDVAAAAEDVVAGVEISRPGLLMIPADGAARFHGGEAELAEKLVVAVAEQADCEASVGMADGLLAAVLAARDGLVVPAGESAAFLAPRPMRDLEYAAMETKQRQGVQDLVDVLDRLGIRSLGDFVALPEADVAARFGVVGAWARRMALGLDVRPPVLRRLEQDISVTYEFEERAERVEQLAFVARRVADELDQELRAKASRCLRVSIAVLTEKGGTLERTWRTDVGAREGAFAKHMTDRVRWQLEGWLSGTADGPEAANLERLTVTAMDVIAAGDEQAYLWGGTSGADARAHRTMERIQGLIGPEAVLVAHEQGGRDPRDRVVFVPWGQEVGAARRVDLPWPGQLPDPAPATVLAEPQPVRVLDAGGREVSVTQRLYLSAAPTYVEMPQRDGSGRNDARAGSSAPAASGVARQRGGLARGDSVAPPLQTVAVSAWAGPWPVAERWWSEDASRRAYLQVALEGGTAVLVATRGGAWALEAIYD